MKYVGGRVLLGTLMILSLALIGCANRNSGAGVPNAVGDFASVTDGYKAVVLVVLPGGSSICSGTIVSPRAVLTAAHCTENSGRFTIKVGTKEYSTFTKFDTGCYDVDCPNDLAILKFDQDIAVRGTDAIYKIASDVRQGEKMRLVGYGCKSIVTRKGSGVKRTGTNAVSEVGEYIEFATPVNSVDDRSAFSRNIIGDQNQAGSCFGDSGGPALNEPNGGSNGSEKELEIAGVTHAGGKSGNFYVSQYVNIASDAANREWLSNINSQESLGIVGL